MINSYVASIGADGQIQGPNLTASTTRTSLLAVAAGAAGKPTIPCQWWDYVGKMMKVVVAGRLSNIVTTPGTLTLDMTFAAVQVWNSGAIQLSAVAHTTLPFLLELWLTCRSIGGGTAATVMAAGRMQSQCIIPAIGVVDAGSHNCLNVPNVTPVVSTGFDSTILNQIDIFGTFSLNNANAIAIEQVAWFDLMKT